MEFQKRQIVSELQFFSTNNSSFILLRPNDKKPYDFKLNATEIFVLSFNMMTLVKLQPQKAFCDLQFPKTYLRFS